MPAITMRAMPSQPVHANCSRNRKTPNSEENASPRYCRQTKNTAALAIEMGADAVDIGKTIHPHPTLGESIGMAAEVAHGSCTDVPPARK